MGVHVDVFRLFPQAAARRKEIEHCGVKYPGINILESSQLEKHVIVLIHAIHGTIVLIEELMRLSLSSGGASDLQTSNQI